ncbi:DUF1758 domain-containing protein [Trichonephila clavipes]|nr:DUF1758 domain-containing protein [Trichonephila clavipes]
MIRLAREGFGRDRGCDATPKDCQKSVHKDEPTTATLISSTTGAKLNCIFCDHPHLSQHCQKLSDRSYEDRKSQVIRKRCCLVCLKIGHLTKICQSRDRTIDNEHKSTETLLTNLLSEHEIYLKTSMIRLQNRDKEVCVRALLNDGSQRSYVEKNLAAELFLSPSGREIFSQGLFGGGISPASEHKRYMLAFRGIKFTDVGRDSPPIQVPLGADILGSILTGRIKVLSSGVSAVETLLGWTILGLGKKRKVVNLVTLSLQNMDVPKMWDLEVLGITDPIEKKNETGHPALYDKYDAAESGLRTVTKRLINENYFEAYDNVFKQWESEDVKQAFLQIRLRTEDRNVLRFLWWENVECSKIRIYRHCRVVFGVSSSTFLLNATISYHLEQEKFQTESFRNTIGHLKEKFYVDNLVTSVNDVTESEQLKSQSIEIMKEGAFELPCWASNNSKEDQDMQMVLGLSWDIVSDELSCKLPSNLDCIQ